MKNNFSDQTRALFQWNYHCFGCGKSKPLTLHHIQGRISASPYNAAPLCSDCHSEGDIHSKAKEEKYLKITKEFLC